MLVVIFEIKIITGNNRCQYLYNCQIIPRHICGMGLFKLSVLSFRNPDGISAADVVNHLTGQQLKQIIKKYGEDPLANKIAHAIVSARNICGRISTTKELADIIENALDG